MRSAAKFLLMLAGSAALVGVTPGAAFGGDDQQFVSAEGLRPRRDCNGFLYRPKRSGVPVYDLPETSGKVLRKLELGERVCVVGERQDFAIIEWKIREEQAAGQGSDSDETSLAFARLVDLWPPRDRPLADGEVGFFRRIKQYVYFIFYGGVPDTPIIAPSMPDSSVMEDGSGCEAAATEDSCKQ